MNTNKNLIIKQIGVIYFALILLICSVTSCHGLRAAHRDDGLFREIGIVNVSGSNLEVFWIHYETKKHILISSPPYLKPNDGFTIKSHVGHQFSIQELPSPKTKRCINGPDKTTCGRAFFTVNAVDKQAFHIGELLEVTIKDTVTIDDERILHPLPSGELSDCEAIALETIESQQQHLSTMDTTTLIQRMTKCVEETVTQQMIHANEEIKYQALLRDKLAEQLENYTCADYELPSSPALRTEYWNHTDLAVTRKVDVLHDRPASKVHVIQNFISKAECAAMEETAIHKLHKATVADGKGGSELSPNRKALQAGIHIPWKKEAKGNLLTKISRRVYDYTDHVLQMGIDEHGQEDLMSIQYKGRGVQDKEPDRYMPHCDGECKGMPHRQGQRMATIVIYCTVPEMGGATNFRKSGLHVVPEEGSATFFSYVDPETMMMDNGFTEHSGCPVIEGEKKIVTQWVRAGVDRENPWNSFNTRECFDFGFELVVCVSLFG